MGNERWKWKAWIDATDSELDQIIDVIWYLHETFPKPVVTKTNRKNKFQLKQTGWGTFLLYADINLKNNKTIALTHQLSFVSAENQNTVTRGAPKKNHPDKQTKVFLSYGVEDSELAIKVSENLQENGYQVLDINNYNPRMPYKLAQQKLLRESDLVMGLVTSDVTSPFVLNDLNQAKQSHKPAVALIEKGIKPLGLDPKLEQISFSMEDYDAPLESFFAKKDKL